MQVVKGNKLRAYGVDQRESNIKIPAARGTIFDRDGNEMAITVPALSLYADPRAVLDPIRISPVARHRAMDHVPNLQNLICWHCKNRVGVGIMGKSPGLHS